MNRGTFLIAIAAIVLTLSVLGEAQDPGWPRESVQSGGTLISYQPQVDQWKDHSTLTWRQAFVLKPAGGKKIIGAATLTGNTFVDNDKHMVVIEGIQITDTYFPQLDPAATGAMDQLLRSFAPSSTTISLERVVACIPKPDSVKTVTLNNNPPFIFVAYSPTILLGTDGEPILAEIKDTKLKYVVNTQWPLFLDTKSGQYYLLVNQRWLSAGDLHGPWSSTAKIPKDMEKLAKDSHWENLKNGIPPPPSGGPIPKVFYSTVPAEVILFDGQPVWAKIPQTELVYATNTDSPLFLYTPTNQYYYLAAGRWFSSSNLEGTWTFASMDLPSDFMQIPLSSPASAILASVPGTEQAKDAVLIAQIPTVMEINPSTAAAQAQVSYNGDPKFEPIEGTSLYYATNTPDKVIKVGDVYYLCLQGVWFVSPSAQGPWTTATSVPQAIYTIPPSSPVYNVTYVTQTTTSSGNVQSSYTAGYLGAFVTGAAVGAIVASGTGYYYPPYVYYPAYGGYPIYHPYPTPYGAYGYAAHYNYSTGAYGVSQTAYGAYGTATRGGSYNPYTGTYARGASTTTPYGKQGVAQAYNPYTGTYAASHQGSSPTAQWGQSYVSNGSEAAYGQHYSTAQGTVGSVQGSQGGKAYGSSSAYGNTAVAKTSNGDLYAGHDGNVYQNSGSGWQKYNNSTNSWQSVNTQQMQQQAHQQAQTLQQQHPPGEANAQQREQSFNQERTSGQWSSQSLNSEMQNRRSGAQESDRFQQHQRAGGTGVSHSWGGRRR